MLKDIKNILLSDDDIDRKAKRIELLFKTVLRQERLKADYLKMRYEKGLCNYERTL
jgi:hypothetical protein